jgi:hypothetical protein
MNRDLVNAFLNKPEPQPLKHHRPAVVLVIVLCCSLLLGWLIETTIRGRHYIVMAVAGVPVFILLSAWGRFRQRRILGKSYNPFGNQEDLLQEANKLQPSTLPDILLAYVNSSGVCS